MEFCFKVQCIELVKRQDLSAETFPRNASLSCSPSSPHSLAQTTESGGRFLPPRSGRLQRDAVGATNSGAGRRQGRPPRPPDPPRSGAPPRTRVGRAAGGARLPGLHSRAPGLRRLPSRDPAGPARPPGARAARASCLVEPNASASSPSRAGVRMRTCAP